MLDAYIGEICLFPYDFTPKAWLPCEGQTLAIASYQALYAVIGTTYGGDGRTSFRLPDLRGRVPMHRGSSISAGQAAGELTHTLTQSELPAHTHAVAGSSSPAAVPGPQGNIWASGRGYASSANASLNAQALSSSGGGQAHSNVQPTAVASYCIAVQGLFPARD